MNINKIITITSSIITEIAKFGIGVIQSFIFLELVFGLIRNDLNLLNVITCLCISILSISVYWSLVLTERDKLLNK